MFIAYSYVLKHRMIEHFFSLPFPKKFNVESFKFCVMGFINIFFENYKNATAGFHFLAKAFILLILTWILIAVGFAIVGTIQMYF